MKYNLEERTLRFAKSIRFYVKGMKRDIADHEICKQLIRSAGSVGANYIEANNSLSKKDLIMRIRISLKESRETRYWLQLLEEANEQGGERDLLQKEIIEISNILGSILQKLL